MKLACVAMWKKAQELKGLACNKLACNGESKHDTATRTGNGEAKQHWISLLVSESKGTV